MAMRKTPEDYHALAAVCGFEWIGPEVGSTKAKTGWRCANGHEWQTRYSHIKQGSGCPVCANCAPKAPEDYYALATERGFEWLGPEVSSVKTKTEWRCRRSHQWWAVYSNIQIGKGCPVCANCDPRTPGDYRNLATERGFEWLGPEVSNVTVSKTQWRCSKGHEWWARYNSVQQGSGCPVCGESRGETAVANTLDSLRIWYRRQARFRKCRNKRPLPFDFSFTFQGVRFLVEYDGAQHDEPVDFFGGEEIFNARQLHDQIKNEFAARYGFKLIRIPYTVENIQTYLIQAIADACGIEFGDVLTSAEKGKTAVKSQSPASQPSIGIQMPLLPNQ